MYEAPENPPVLQSELSIRKTLKDSWGLSTKYFNALVIPFLIILIPNLCLWLSRKEESSFGILTLMLPPIAIMGIHRSLFLLKSEGKHPTLRQTFEHGNEYWGRGFKLDLVNFLYLIPLLVLIICFMTPSFRVVDKNSAIWAVYFLSGLTISVILFYLFLARTCIAPAAMADKKLGAFEAYRLAWTLTKGKTSKITLLVATISAIFVFVLIPIFFLFGGILGILLCALFGIKSDFSESHILWIPIILLFWFIYGFYITYIHISYNIIYQKLRPIEQNTIKEDYPTK